MRYIYCHPLFDERKCSHRFSYQLDKTFEKNNLLMERFDYQGTGETQGRFCDVTFDSLKNDLATIVGKDRSCLIGTRLGAAVAFDFCCHKESNINKLILIEPVINGPSYVEYLFRKQHIKDLMTGNKTRFSNEDEFFNLEGYKTGSKFIAQIKQLYLENIMNTIKVDSVFLIQISASSRITPEYESFAEHLQRRNIPVSIGIFNLPYFWERLPDGDYSIISKKILEWCK